MIFTFILTTFAWIFFRSNNLQQAFDISSEILSISFFTIPKFIPLLTLLFLFIFLTIEWIGRNDRFAIERVLLDYSVIIRWLFYFILVSSIFVFPGKQQEFIYFQF